MNLTALWFILIAVLWTGYFVPAGFDLTAGGATFAAFPLWSTSPFSGFYLALLIILVTLTLRRAAMSPPRWPRSRCCPRWRPSRARGRAGPSRSRGDYRGRRGDALR